MDVFDCDGWLYITINTSFKAVIKLGHAEDLLNYCSISVSDDIKQLVKDNTHLTVTQVLTLASVSPCLLIILGSYGA